MGKIIAIANQKGGVGKTTTAISLAACLGKLGKKILLVDVDPQSNATSGLGVDKNEIGHGIYECMLGQESTADALRALPWENLSLLPAKRNLAGAEIELIGMERREFFLSSCLGACKDIFEFTFIDCPPSLGLLTVNALTAADSVLMPIQSEYYALEGLGQLLETYNLVRQRLNPLLSLEGILLTMADLRTNLSEQVENEVRTHFGDLVFKTVIGRNVRLGEAPGFGKPIVEYDPLSAGAQAYMRLAKEFLGRHGMEAAEGNAGADNLETRAGDDSRAAEGSSGPLTPGSVGEGNPAQNG
jgi:chromosome partitioning protein